MPEYEIVADDSKYGSYFEIEMEDEAPFKELTVNLLEGTVQVPESPTE